MSPAFAEKFPSTFALLRIRPGEVCSGVLAVIVPGSPLRHHFAGPSYVRKGSETVLPQLEMEKAFVR